MTLLQGSTFRGTTALLRSRRGTLTTYPLWAGLVPAAGFGALANLTRSTDPRTLADVVGPACIMACGIAPLLATLPWTSSLNANAPSRRDELLTLPIGRLALPSAAALLSLLVLAAWVLAGLLGLSLTVGTRAVTATLASPYFVEQTLDWGLFAALAAFAMSWALGAAGGSAAAMAPLWPLAPFGAISAMRGMGYDRETSEGAIKVITVVMGAYLLLLPFLLYARPAHLWAASRQKALEAPHTTAFATTLLAVMTLGLAGPGPGLLLLVLAGAAASWVLARRRPPGDRASAMRLVHASGLVVVLPLVACGLAIEARAGATPGAWEDVTVELLGLSPDGRHAAVRLRPRPDGLPRAATRQVAVVDLTGARQPLLVPARFADLPDAGAWSRTGRWLAVEDATIGRLESPHTHLWSAGMDLGPLEAVATRARLALDEVWLVDTETWSIERRGGLDVAAGWERPEELVRVGLAGAGRYEVTGGDGRVVGSGFDERHAPYVVCYLGGEALLSGPVATLTRRDAERGALPTTARAFRKDALVDVDPVAPGRWVERFPPAPTEPGTPFRTVTLLRDGQERALEGLSAVLLQASDARSVVACDASGLVRIALPGGERTVIVPRGEQPSLQLRWVAPDGRRALVRCHGATLLVDLTTDRVTPAPDGAVAACEGGFVVEGPDGWPRRLP